MMHIGRHTAVLCFALAVLGVAGAFSQTPRQADAPREAGTVIRVLPLKDSKPQGKVLVEALLVEPDVRAVNFYVDGEHYETQAELCQTIRDHHKCWGFARTHKNEIHVWLGDAPFDDVLFLLGHEYGHFESEEWCCQYDEREELCNAFGQVALRAYNTARALVDWRDA